MQQERRLAGRGDELRLVIPATLPVGAVVSPHIVGDFAQALLRAEHHVRAAVLLLEITALLIRQALTDTLEPAIYRLLLHLLWNVPSLVEQGNDRLILHRLLHRIGVDHAAETGDRVLVLT